MWTLRARWVSAKIGAVRVKCSWDCVLSQLQCFCAVFSSQGTGLCRVQYNKPGTLDGETWVWKLGTVWLLWFLIFVPGSLIYKDLTMENNSHMIPGSQVPWNFPLAPGLILIGSPNVHQSYKSSSTPGNPVTQGSSSTSGPPYSQDSQAPPRTHISPNDPKRQQKRTVFTKKQKLVLQAHFDKGMYLNQKQCKELSETLGLKESSIKVWLLSYLSFL